MEERREIRFLIPPFIFLFSVLWSEWSAQGSLWCFLVTHIVDEHSLLGAALFSVGAVVPLGFLISSVTVAFLRILFCALWKFELTEYGPSYEVQIPLDLITEGIWRKIPQNNRIATPKPPFNKLRRYDLPLYGTFDHLKLEKRVRDWIGRRWNMFLVSAHSITAIIMSILFVKLIGVDIKAGGCARWIPIAVIIPLLFWNAYVAYGESMRMSEIQVRRLV
jgi:hypothetical protein